MEEEFMAEAFLLAEQSLADKEVPVGCVFVDELQKKIVARGRNRPMQTRDATRHAEMEALDVYVAGRRCSQLVVYVTVEPCIMCAAALKYLGEVTRVVFGCFNTKFGGCGSVLDLSREELGGCGVFEGVHAREHEERAVVLLREFYTCENTHAPRPKKKTRRVVKPFI
ncbi:MAG: tRNA specific adenosine deaminase [Amphiamblys sp. WSBS2006]|nr:MAG: tRNA specific adenosine deaminase [Amphiamblys sp. WSBS2006]